MRFWLQLGLGSLAALLAAFVSLRFQLHESPPLFVALLMLVGCAGPLASIGAAGPGTNPTEATRRGGSRPDTKGPHKSAAAEAPAARETPAPATPPGREVGEIKWFNVSKGFGFIRRENGEEIFVHFRSIQGQHRDRRHLQDGQKVSFVVAQSDKGPQAEEVKTITR